ncbi:MAG: sulfotransferase, partial [Gemmatimonadales bacterium]|nr:sulfotransferase [Gemmatimonadales bacterium]
MRFKPPVFVLGSPRSGTTWLYHLLLSSGGFAIYRAEARVFDMLAPRFGRFLNRTDRERLLAQWLPSELFLRSGLEAEAISARVLEQCGSPGDFLRILMEAIALEQGAVRWAECTPDNVFFMSEIKASFPDARFIHMVRDGRDVALSLARQGWILPYRWDTARPSVPAALYWERAVRAGREGGRRVHPDYLEVRFEDMVRDPEGALAGVATFLEHRLDYAKIQRSAIGSVARPNTSFGGDLEADPIFSPIERWRSSYAERDLRLIEALIGPTLEELGYSLSTEREGRRLPVLERANRMLYRLRFASRTLLKSGTPLGRWLVDISILKGGWGG